MHTWMIWTRVPVADESLNGIVAARGGYWKEEGGREAVLDEGTARVFISASSNLSEAYADDVEHATELLGERPKGIVWINVGHGDASERLAETIAAEVVRQWPGVLDKNEL
jgi:hypothetical protein